MKKLSLMVVFALFLGIVSGISAAIAAEKTLTVVSPWKIKGMDISKSGFLFARMGCLEMLTTTNDSGEITGSLADSWKMSDDKLTWTFSLKPGVKFHDGTPMTAEAVATSLQNSIDNKGQVSKADIVSLNPIDDLTLEITTAKPFSSLLAHLAHYSAGIVSPASYDESGKTIKIVATGQFIFVKSEGDTRFLFEANKDYWGEKAKVESAEYQAVPKGETRGFMMKAGQADMAFTLTPSDAKQLVDEKLAKVHTMVIPRSRIMLLNCSLPMFSDVRVRKAISMAINRPGIAEGLLRNPESAATQLLAPAVSMWHNKDLAPLTYDPEGAKALLAEAGWKPGADGILEKDGSRFQFELLTYASRPMLPPIATAMQQQLLDVGIEMSINVGESSLIPDKNKDGTLQAAFVARNFGQIPDAVGNIYGDFGPNPGSWGPMGWQSSELNKLLDDYMAEFDAGGSADIRKKIIAILQEELPAIPVTWYEHIVAVSNRIEGVNIDPFEIKSYINGARWAE